MPARQYDGERRGYSPALVEKICAALAAGRSLKSICADKGMPTERTTYRWLAASAEFQALYALAHKLQFETLVDEILDIADDASNDIKRARLRIGTRKWMLAIRQPVKYRTGLSYDCERLPVTKVVREIVWAGEKEASGG